MVRSRCITASQQAFGCDILSAPPLAWTCFPGNRSTQQHQTSLPALLNVSSRSTYISASGARLRGGGQPPRCAHGRVPAAAGGAVGRGHARPRGPAGSPWPDAAAVPASAAARRQVHFSLGSNSQQAAAASIVRGSQRDSQQGSLLFAGRWSARTEPLVQGCAPAASGRQHLDMQRKIGNVQTACTVGSCRLTSSTRWRRWWWTRRSWRVRCGPHRQQEAAAQRQCRRPSTPRQCGSSSRGCSASHCRSSRTRVQQRGWLVCSQAGSRKRQEPASRWRCSPVLRASWRPR